MCTGAEIPLILTALGTGAQVVDQQRALRQQDEEAARGIMRQAELQREASRKVGQNIEELKRSTPEDERRMAQTDFMSALRERMSGDTNLQPAGAVSDRFSSDVGRAQADVGTESGQLAGRLARVDAAGLQRLHEGQQAASTASELSLLGDDSKALDFLTRLRAAGRTANPFVQGAGQGLAAFGGAYASRAQPQPLPRSSTGSNLQVPVVPRKTLPPHVGGGIFGGY